jgi:ParB family chromosome partitioning protein
MIDKRGRTGLGRGLSALMADVSTSAPAAGGPSSPTSILPVEALIPNPDQPRRQFDAEALAELTASIREKGVVQPLIVRPTSVPGKFEIVAGERRWRASQAAELHEVPVVIRDYTDEEVLQIAIIENIQRADLNALEEALAYRQLVDRFGHTQERLALSLSRSRSHIANTLRLLSLPPQVLDLVQHGKLSAGHARALITSPDSVKLALDVVKRGLSVRETERLAQKPVTPSGKAKVRKSSKDADTIAIEQDLSANLGLKVSLTHSETDRAGTLTIAYKSLEDLDFLCEALSNVQRNAL